MYLKNQVLKNFLGLTVMGLYLSGNGATEFSGWFWTLGCLFSCFLCLYHKADRTVFYQMPALKAWHLQVDV